MKLLFVCLGNICRSPAAEGIMEQKITQAGITNIQVDSAGTYGGHSGERADKRMRQAAAERGYDLKSRSRKIRTDDLRESDMILVMDDRNPQDVRAIAPDLESLDKIHKMTDFCTRHQHDHVPDPYYEGIEGFHLVIDILEDACEGLLQKIAESKA